MTSTMSGEELNRPLYVSIEMVANLVFLARETEGKLEEQRGYLERASELLLALREHPQLAH
jgi:hypothetical protein